MKPDGKWLTGIPRTEEECMETWFTPTEKLPGDGDSVIVDDGFGQEHAGEFSLTASGESVWPSNDGQGHDEGDIKWRKG